MKQHFYSFLLTMLLCMAGATAFAHDIEVKNDDGVTIYYRWINNDTELMVSYRGSSYHSYSDRYSGVVVIPSSVTYNGSTYSVTIIGSYAFYGCSGLTSVTIPNSVRGILNYAFYGCSLLETITIPDAVYNIGGGAFYGTKWLDNQPNGLVYAGKVLYMYKGSIPTNTSLSLRDGTLGIVSCAFENCSNLVSINMPNSVKHIGSGAFSGCI